MPKSLIRGDYSLLMAIESASRPNSWYRVLADRQTGKLSCDCPPWTFNKQPNAQGERTCTHTSFVSALAAAQSTAPSPSDGTAPYDASSETLIQAVQQQWPGLRGQWSLEKKAARINNKPYHLVLLRLQLGNGTGIATGIIAFAEQHAITGERMLAGVASWCGYAIAAEVARLGGYPMAGQPPEHFRVQPSSRRQSSLEGTLSYSPFPQFGLANILRIGDEIQRADGLQPAQRAEHTLRLFLGEELYQQLERQGFLDVSSVQYGPEERVYRLRRDPHKQRERRVRIFEHGHYVRDYCIVRGQAVPEPDHFLTVFLGLLSDEMTTLSVVGHSNIFAPYSDSPLKETLPVQWQPRVAVVPLESNS